MRVLNKRHGGISADAVYIGRPGPFGNPFVIGRDGDRQRVIELYTACIQADPQLIERVRRELRGRDLVCWCAPAACHGDVLLRIANS